METPNLSNKVILVVEDDERNWFLVRDMIEMAGGITIWSESGQKAIELLQQGEKIDLVLMDIQLPFMSGVKATKLIREFNTKIPILAHTAFSQPENIQEYKEAGINDYVFKPLDFQLFYATLVKYL